MIQKIELIHPLKNRWSIRWNLADTEDGFTCESKEFIGKPSPELIKKTILDWHNAEIDRKILSGHTWRGKPVWLSSENQFNYKASFDLAVQTDGESLPVKCKFGDDDNPDYHIFQDLDEFREFYRSIVDYIQSTVESGWSAKDSINWSDYD